jgi:subtilisin
VLDKSGFGLESDIIEAFMWCIDNGIHVANCSFGSSNGSPVEEQALDVMINQHGIGVCAAAGNDGGRFISYPKGDGFAGLIGVAAVNSDNTWADFSNIDATNDISAYGVGILSACKGNIYQYMDGTSMATPHMTGLYALILSYLGSASPADIEATIRKTATPLGDPDYFGAGLGRADGFYGSARISPRTVKQQHIIDELLGGR